METAIMKEILKYDFYLSKWFAGKKQDKIIPGASFLFLNQVSFLFLATFLFVVKLLPFTLSPKISTGVAMLVVLFVMYGLQNRVQTKVQENKYDKGYNVLTKREIYKNRLIAVLLFVMPFILCFIVAILFYR
jgi:hypothetical protein